MRLLSLAKVFVLPALFCACLCCEAASRLAAVAPHILTPPSQPTPRVNGPTVFGVRPGSAFLYTIPASGQRPMTFAADGLPQGLTLNAVTGRISGVLASPGEHQLTLLFDRGKSLDERIFAEQFLV